MNTSDSSQLLIQQATSGDRAAAAELLVYHGERLARRLEARLKLNPFADFSAEDVLQEVFVDVFRGIGTFQLDRGVPFAAWLDRVADNRLATFFRDRSRLKRGGGAWRLDTRDSSGIQLINDLDDGRVGTASGHFAASEAKRAVELCVASLPDEQREAVERFYLKQQQLSEIAEAMGTTKDAVRSLLYRAKQSMRTMMGASSRWFSKR